MVGSIHPAGSQSTGIIRTPAEAAGSSSGLTPKYGLGLGGQKEDVMKEWGISYSWRARGRVGGPSRWEDPFRVTATFMVRCLETFGSPCTKVRILGAKLGCRMGSQEGPQLPLASWAGRGDPGGEGLHTLTHMHRHA